MKFETRCAALVIIGWLGFNVTPAIADYKFAVARYNGFGALDGGFDGDGKVSSNLTSTTEDAQDVAIDSRGRVVVAGRAEYSGAYRFAVTRYHANGNLDLTFNGDGIAVTNLSSDREEAYAVAVQADRKVILGGRAHYADGWRFALVRYNEDGSLDGTFDGDGIVVSNFASSTDEGVEALMIQGDGKIVAVGWATIDGHSQFAAARYYSDGRLDADAGAHVGFDGDGKALVNFTTSSDEYAWAGAIDGGGRIVMAGTASNGMAVARLETDGSPDQNFDGDGKVLVDFVNQTEECYGVAIDLDGRIILAGACSSADGWVFAEARLRTNGALDGTFGGRADGTWDGKQTTNFPGSDDERGRAVFVIPGSPTFLVAGWGASPFRACTYSQFAVARFNEDGSLDFGWSADGLVLTDWLVSCGGANGITRDPATGNMVAAGYMGDLVAAGGAGLEAGPDAGDASESPSGGAEPPSAGDPFAGHSGNGLALAAPSPNPVGARTTLAFELTSEREVRLEIFDIRGARVQTLAEGRWSAGPHQVTWDAKDRTGARVHRGIYFVRLASGRDVQSRTLVVAD